MREAQARTIHLKDYAPPAFLIDRVNLDVDIRADGAIVKASLAVRRNPDSKRDKNFLPFRAAQSERLGPDPGG